MEHHTRCQVDEPQFGPPRFWLCVEGCPVLSDHRLQQLSTILETPPHMLVVRVRSLLKEVATLRAEIAVLTYKDDMGR